MSFVTCTAEVRSGTSAPFITQYLGGDGILYNVANREIITLANNLTLSAGLSPFIRSNWFSGSGKVYATGVILDALGNEYTRFYPANIMTPAYSFGPTQAYFPSNPVTPMPSGDYTVLTFELVIDDPEGRTKGSSQICIGGTQITPTPTPTFVPTVTPTATPVPPTPTPTATPVS